MVSKRFRAIVAGTSALLAICAIAAHEVVRRHIEDRVYVVGYEHNPQHMIRVRGGEPSGDAIDTLRQAAQRSGIRLRFEYHPESAYKALTEGHVDLWPLMTDLPERHRRIYFTRPWMMTSYYLVSRSARNVVPDEDLQAKLVCDHVPVNAEMLRARFPRATVTSLDSLDSVVSAVCEGRADYGLLHDRFAISASNSLEHGCMAEDLPLRLFPMSFRGRTAIGSTYEASAAADRLRTEISAMLADGSLAVIMSRYSSTGYNEMRSAMDLAEAEHNARLLGITLSVATILLLGVAWLAWRLRLAQRAATRASEVKSGFLANMSHEIRTPLTGLNGMLDLALETELTGEQREYLVLARTSAASLHNLLNDILDLSKLEARRMELIPGDFSISECVAEVLRLMSGLAHQKGLALTSAVGETTPESVRGDELRLRQILLNLVGNALKFTTVGCVEVRVRPLELKTATVMEFAVRDTGPGIAPDKQALIFETYRQAGSSSAHRSGGSGLGLAISHCLVELMKGRMWLESEPGRGSTFYFTARFEQSSRPPRA